MTTFMDMHTEALVEELNECFTLLIDPLTGDERDEREEDQQ